MSDGIIEYEKQLLFFLFKDEKFVEQVISVQRITKDFFHDEMTSILFGIVKEYYEKYKKVIVEDELTNVLDNMFSSKKIDGPEHKTLFFMYDEIANSEEYFFEDEQFDRIFEEWKDASQTPKLKEAIKKILPYLDENKGLMAAKKIQEYISEITSVSEKSEYVEQMSLKHDVERQINDIINRRDNKEKFQGIPTGMDALDKIFNGFEKRSLTLVGGFTGHGKSTMMINLSKNIFEMGKKVLIITLEMPPEQWARKFDAMYCMVPSDSLVKGTVTDYQLERIKEKLEERRNGEGEYEILYAPPKSCTWKQLMNEAKNRFPNFQPDIIFVDQLSLINLGEYQRLKPSDAYGLLAKDIRAYSFVNHVPIVLAVQANRSSITRSKDGAKRVIHVEIENIEDSNKVGADCDNFIAVHKPNEKNIVLVRIAKQRDGETGDVELSANLKFALIYDKNSGVAKEIEEIEKEFNDAKGKISPEPEEDKDEDKDFTIEDLINVQNGKESDKEEGFLGSDISDLKDPFEEEEEETIVKKAPKNKYMKTEDIGLSFLQ